MAVVQVQLQELGMTIVSEMIAAVFAHGIDGEINSLISHVRR
jgi:hypothetical protein